MSTRISRPNLSVIPNSTTEDREIAILLVAYPDRMRRAEAEDLWALFDFLVDENPGFDHHSGIPERGGNR